MLDPYCIEVPLRNKMDMQLQRVVLFIWTGVLN